MIPDNYQDNPFWNYLKIRKITPCQKKSTMGPKVCHQAERRSVATLTKRLFLLLQSSSQVGMNVCTNIHKINLNNFVTFYSTNNQSRAVYRVVNAANKAYNKNSCFRPLYFIL